MSGLSLGFLLDFFRSQLFLTLPLPDKSYAGKTVIVTGSNVGLGLAAAKHFAKLGASKLILAVRTLEKGEAAKKEIEAETGCDKGSIEVWQLDLTSYESVKQFAARATKDLERIDALVENAGINTSKFRMAEDNESTVTTNVVSTFLLALLMLPKLKETAQKFNVQPNLTIVASEVQYFTAFPEQNAAKGTIFDTLNDKASARMYDRYNVSKLLEVYTVRELAELTKNPSCYGTSSTPGPVKTTNTYPVTINCLNPGLCKSEIAREMPKLVVAIMMSIARTLEHGSRTLVHAAGAGGETHGEYLTNCAIGTPAPIVVSDKGARLQKTVWNELSQKLEAISPGILQNI